MKKTPRNGFLRLLSKRERTLLLMRAGEGGDCWEWLGGHNSEGYAIFAFERKRVTASRAVWCIANDCEWPDGKIAMHSCDNPGCVNPSHIKPATDAENMIDRSAKGRQAHGAGHGGAKLTDEAVREARALRLTGMSYERIAKRYGVSKKTAMCAVNGETWKHIPLIATLT